MPAEGVKLSGPHSRGQAKGQSDAFLHSSIFAHVKVRVTLLFGTVSHRFAA